MTNDTCCERTHGFQSSYRNTGKPLMEKENDNYMYLKTLNLKSQNARQPKIQIMFGNLLEFLENSQSLQVSFLPLKSDCPAYSLVLESENLIVSISGPCTLEKK